MDEQKVKAIAGEVIRELGLGQNGFVVEPAMSGAVAEDIQIRILEGDGDGKAVVVSLADADRQALDDEGLRRRIREQLATFAAISVDA
jgi:hypothetical protein